MFEPLLTPHYLDPVVRELVALSKQGIVTAQGSGQDNLFGFELLYNIGDFGIPGHDHGQPIYLGYVAVGRGLIYGHGVDIQPGPTFRF